MKFTNVSLGCMIVGALLTSAGATEPVTCQIELDRATLPAGASTRAVVKVTLDAPTVPVKTDRPAVNLAIVLDRSGSMSGSKMEQAREAAVTALRRLGPKDVFSLVIYDNEIQTLISAQQVKNVDELEATIRGIQTGGGTALFGGVSQGASELRKFNNGDFVNRLILLSDGLANVGPSSPDELGRLGASLSKEGITVTTVGVGNDYNEDLMITMAQKSDGNSYFVENSDDLPRIFGAELGDVLSVVAQDVVLTVEFTDGCRPVRLIGREGLVRDHTVEVSLKQLYGGQQKYALIEVDVPTTEAGQTRRVATATCRYQSAIDKKAMVSTASAVAAFSAVAEEVVQSANIQVQGDLVKNYAAEAKEEAVRRADMGDKDGAAKVLRDESARIKSITVQYAVESPAPAELATEAEEVQAEGIAGDKRKAYKTGSYQEKNQQYAH